MSRRYLTEESLGEFLSKRFDENIISNGEFLGYTPDYRSEKYKTIIEFDGSIHYQLPKNILKDYEKDAVFDREGYSVIRIPYFVQLDERVIQLLFPNIENQSTYNNFPQGFASKRFPLPSSFCELGIYRFLRDLEKFEVIQKDIIVSLIEKIIELGDDKLVITDSIKEEYYTFQV